MAARGARGVSARSLNPMGVSEIFAKHFGAASFGLTTPRVEVLFMSNFGAQLSDR
ncbi:hypothetical protein FB004_109191 [Sinorhizobium medicae]|nr:hypothetical protein FB004_109191 [Sinorhizobium medicae]